MGRDNVHRNYQASSWLTSRQRRSGNGLRNRMAKGPADGAEGMMVQGPGARRERGAGPHLSWRALRQAALAEMAPPRACDNTCTTSSVSPTLAAARVSPRRLNATCMHVMPSSVSALVHRCVAAQLYLVCVHSRMPQVTVVPGLAGHPVTSDSMGAWTRSWVVQRPSRHVLQCELAREDMCADAVRRIRSDGMPGLDGLCGVRWP